MARDQAPQSLGPSAYNDGRGRLPAAVGFLWQRSQMPGPVD